jgi:hypothetical protein
LHSEVYLIIAADDSFTAILKGCKTFTGSNWRTVNRFLLRNLNCGIDTLVITVENSEVDSLLLSFSLCPEPIQLLQL